jgi:hypothetical protein
VPLQRSAPLPDPAGTQVLAAQVNEPTQRLAAATPPINPTQRLAAATPPINPTQRLAAATPPINPTERLDVSAPPVDPTRRFEVATPPVDPTRRLGAGLPPVKPPWPVETTPPATLPASRGNRSHWQPLAYAALLVAALGVAYLLTQLGDQGANTAAPLAARVTTPAVSAKPAPPASPSTPAQTTASPPAQVPARPGNSGRGHKNLEKFVTAYYSEVTKNTDRTWDQLTPRMQDAAGGREGYNTFWRAIDKVEVNQFQENGSGDSAVVNLTFTRNDGTSSTETHQFTFVTDRGDTFIESDQFLR